LAWRPSGREDAVAPEVAENDVVETKEDAFAPEDAESSVEKVR